MIIRERHKDSKDSKDSKDNQKGTYNDGSSGSIFTLVLDELDHLSACDLDYLNKADFTHLFGGGRSQANNGSSTQSSANASQIEFGHDLYAHNSVLIQIVQRHFRNSTM